MEVSVSRDRSGFSLIETLVSIAILTICLAAIMGMFSALSMANVRSEIRTKMVNELSGFVNNTISDSFSNIKSTTVSGAVRVRSFSVPYTIVSTVTDSVLPGGIEKKKIVATISWKYRGGDYSYSITTVVVNE